MKQLLIQRKQKHTTSWKLSMTSCAVKGQVYPAQHVANMLLSFRLRSYSKSRVTSQCHEQFVTYITLIANDCVYLLDNVERHVCRLRRCFRYSADILQCQHYLIYLQISQATQFRNFEKKLIYILKYNYIKYVILFVHITRLFYTQLCFTFRGLEVV